jgi:hypothetical protein
MSELRIETCDKCKHPLVLIDYYGKRLKGCLSCNAWGNPGGSLWTRLPDQDVCALEAMIHDRTGDTARRVHGWQPIEKAPKDGRFVRLRRGDQEAIARWHAKLNAWSLGPAREAYNRAESLLPWEPTDWAPL